VDLDLPPRSPPAADQEARLLLHVGLSFFLHVALLGASAVAIPALGEAGDANPRETAQYLLAQAFADPAEREEDEAPAEPATTSDADGRPAVPSRCGELRGGSMGKPAAGDRPLRYGVQGPADNPDPHVARLVGSGVGMSWGSADIWAMIGLPEPDASGGDPAAPVALWGREASLGTDPTSARGHMWGDDYGDTFGSPGAGLGRHELCETCGDTGTGAAAGPTPAPGPEDAPPAGCLGLLLITD
jgi:hypothetical protein